MTCRLFSPSFSSGGIRLFEPTLHDARLGPLLRASAAWVVVVVVAAVAIGWFAPPAFGQPPGTPPPEQWKWKRWDGVRPEAFLFLDEARTPVVMPRMSFEEIERLRRLDRGQTSADQGVVLRRLQLEGTVRDQRAELEVTLEFIVEPTSTTFSSKPNENEDENENGSDRNLSDESQRRDSQGDRSEQPGRETTGDERNESNDPDSSGPESSDAESSDAESSVADSSEADVSVAESAGFENEVTTVTEIAGSANPGDSGRASPRRPPLVVPLNMQGFHLLEPPRIRGIQNARIQLASDSESPTRQGIDDRNGQPATKTMSPAAGLTSAPDPTRGGSLAESTAGPGYQLLVPAPEPDGETIEGELTMRVSAKVYSLGPSLFALPVHLPVAPTVMTIEMEDANPRAAPTAMTAEVIGTGREVLQRIGDETASPKFRIESDGGLFSLNWQRSSITEDAGRLLEVTSKAELRWQSPTETPTMDVRLQVENLRGRLRRVDVEVPAGMVLLRAPEAVAVEAGVPTETGRLISAGSTWRIVGSDRTAGGSSGDDSGADQRRSQASREDAPRLIQLEKIDSRPMPLAALPSADGVRSTVEVRLALQSPVLDANPTQPWVVRLPKVVDAIAQRGEVTIQTTEDHRLRWRPQPGVEAVTTNPPSSVTGEQTHVFRFARNAFGLPIWLSSQQRQTRVSVDVALAVNRQSAVATMTVQGQASGMDPKDLRLELGNWRLRSLETGSAETPMPEISEADGVVEWQVDATEGKWPDQYQIELERAWQEGTEVLRLPRLRSVESSSVISEVTVELIRRGREAWVVDLSASPRLQRVFQDEAERYRLLSVDEPWEMAGAFVRRPLRLKLTGGTSWSSRDEIWTTRTSWEISSEVDLEGQLSFDYPDAAAEEIQWVALVDGMPAQVRLSESRPDRWHIVSPRLAAGTVAVDLTGEVPFTLALGDSQSQRAGSRTDRSDSSFAGNGSGSSASSARIGPADSSVADAASTEGGSDRETAFANETPTWIAGVPRPVADNLDLESPYQLEIAELLADRWGRLWQIKPAEPRGLYDLQPSASRRPVGGVGDHIWLLADVPDFAIPLAIRSTASEDRMVKVPRALIRSLVSDQTRHEHLIATVEGGQRIRLELDPRLASLRIEATFDGQPVLIVRQRDGLVLDLPEIDSSSAVNENATARQGDRRGEPAGRPHLLDVRLWAEVGSSAWWSQLQPLMQLPVQSGWVYWELIVPSDTHLFWASPSSGRAMRWQREQLRMLRRPLLNDDQLVDWATGRAAADGRAGSTYGPFRPVNTGELQSAADGPSPVAGSSLPPSWIGGWEAEWDPRWTDNPAFSSPGNRYLFYAGESYAFSAATVSRTALWLIVGGLMVALSTIFHLFPSLRHPTVVVVLAAVLAGVLVVAPDGVILTGQLVLLSLALVAVLYAIAALVSPSTSRRVLRPRSAPPVSASREGSGREGSGRGGAGRDGSGREVSPSEGHEAISFSHREADEAGLNGSSATGRLNPWTQRDSEVSEPVSPSSGVASNEGDSTWTARRQGAAQTSLQDPQAPPQDSSGKSGASYQADDADAGPFDERPAADRAGDPTDPGDPTADWPPPLAKASGDRQASSDRVAERSSDAIRHATRPESSASSRSSGAGQ